MRAKWPIRPALISSCSYMKQATRSILLSPGWKASPSLSPLSIKFTGKYSAWVERGNVGVKSRTQEHSHNVYVHRASSIVVENKKSVQVQASRGLCQ